MFHVIALVCSFGCRGATGHETPTQSTQSSDSKQPSESSSNSQSSKVISTPQQHKQVQRNQEARSPASVNGQTDASNLKQQDAKAAAPAKIHVSDAVAQSVFHRVYKFYECPEAERINTWKPSAPFLPEVMSEIHFYLNNVPSTSDVHAGYRMKPKARTACNINFAETEEGTPCITLNKDQKEWWSYEWCHNRWIRQFHVEKGIIVSEQYLGFGPHAHKVFDLGAHDLDRLRPSDTSLPPVDPDSLHFYLEHRGIIENPIIQSLDKTHNADYSLLDDIAAKKNLAYSDGIFTLQQKIVSDQSKSTSLLKKRLEKEKKKKTGGQAQAGVNPVKLDTKEQMNQALIKQVLSDGLKGTEGALYCSQWVDTQQERMMQRVAAQRTTAAAAITPIGTTKPAKLLSTLMTRGSWCDAIDNYRETLIVFTCERAKEVLLSFNVTEISTCSYVMYVYGSVVCSMLNLNTETIRPQSVSGDRQSCGAPSDPLTKESGVAASRQPAQSGESAAQQMQHKISSNIDLTNPSEKDLADMQTIDTSPIFKESLIFSLSV